MSGSGNEGTLAQTGVGFTIFGTGFGVGDMVSVAIICVALGVALIVTSVIAKKRRSAN